MVRLFRDEILCQICKQLNDHPAIRDKKSRNPEKAEQRERSYMRGWFLLCVCLYTFPPGSNVRPVFLCLLREKIDLFSWFDFFEISSKVVRQVLPILLNSLSDELIAMEIGTNH